MTVYYDTAENLHPYECNGQGKCRHCDRAEIDDHDPATCALCDPDYDFMPNPHRPALALAGETQPKETDQSNWQPPSHSHSPS